MGGDIGHRTRGVWGLQPRSGQEKEVIYSLKKHLCIKHLLSAGRVQVPRELTS